MILNRKWKAAESPPNGRSSAIPAGMAGGLLGMLTAAILLLSCLPPFSAGALSGAGIFVKTAGQPDQMLVTLQSSVSGNRLYLPSGTDLSRLQLFYEGGSPITIDGREYKSGEVTGAFASGGRVKLARGNQTLSLSIMVSANIPSLFLTTESGGLEQIRKTKEHSERGTWLLADSTGRAQNSGRLTQIRGRGQTTFYKSKLPFQFRLESSADLLGLGKGKTWVLLANYLDNSLLRNKVAFDLAKAAGMSPVMASAFVDLYINGAYAGNYLLCEKIQIRDNRVDIFDLQEATEELNSFPMGAYRPFGKGSSPGSQKGVDGAVNPKDITGGYLLEMNVSKRYVAESSGFVTGRGLPLAIKSPEFATREQVQYIASFIQGFERAIFAPGGIDPNTLKHYSGFIDMDSLVRKVLLEEITKNYDGNKNSQFLYKPSDSQSLTAFLGPPWDYDYSMGNFAKENNISIAQPYGLFVTKDKGKAYYWYPALYRQPDFYEALLKSYYEEFLPALNTLTGTTQDDSGGLLSIREQAELLSKSAAMNFRLQNVFNISGRPVKTGSDYQENIDYLNRWLLTRMAYLDTVWLEDYQALKGQ